MALRTAAEPERGLYLAESEKVIRRALRGRAPAALATCMARALARPTSPTWSRDAEADGRAGVRRRAAGDRGDHRVPPAPRARWPRCTGPSCPRRRPLLAGARRVAVLEDIVDHTNVGAVFRVGRGPRGRRGAGHPALRGPALPAQRPGLDGHGVPGAVDPHRARGPAGVEALRDSGFTRRRLRADRRRRQPRRARRGRRPSGWRWSSAPRATACRGARSAAADLVVRIPMAGGVDSLNVAAASAVALWALRPPQR